MYTTVIHVGAQPGTAPVLALGCHKIPVPALGKFVFVVAPPCQYHLGLYSLRVRHPVLELGTQCQHWVPILARCQNGDEFSECQHWVKKVPVPELGQCQNGG